MDIDYWQVVRDMEERGAALEKQLEEIKLALPALRSFAESQGKRVPQRSETKSFAGMGTQDAILILLAEKSTPVQAGDIAKELLSCGVKTKSTNFATVVASTLGQMKTGGKVERRDDGWILIPTNSSDIGTTGPTRPSLQ